MAYSRKRVAGIKRLFMAADVHCGWCQRPYQDLLAALAHMRAHHPTKMVTHPEFGHAAAA